MAVREARESEMMSTLCGEVGMGDLLCRIGIGELHGVRPYGWLQNFYGIIVGFGFSMEKA